MTFLRLIALMMVIFVLIVPPILIGEPGPGTMSGWSVTSMLLALSLTVASFLYIATAGDRMRRRGYERMLGALLMLIPMGGGLTLLASRHDPLQLFSSGILFALSLFLFIGVVFPSLVQRQRPMRRRDHHDTIVSSLHRPL